METNVIKYITRKLLLILLLINTINKQIKKNEVKK